MTAYSQDLGHRAEEAAREGRYREALELAREFDRWVRDPTGGGARPELRARADLQVGRFAAYVGRASEARARLLPLMDLPDPNDIADALLALVFVVDGPDDRQRMLDGVENIEEAVDDRTLVSATGRLLALCRYLRAELEQYDDHVARAQLLQRVFTDRHLEPEDRIQVRLAYGNAARYGASLAVGDDQARIALEEAELLGDPRWLVKARSRIGSYLLDSGHEQAARTELERALEEAREAGLMFDAAVICNALGEIERVLDNKRAAVTWYAETIRLCDGLEARDKSAVPRFNLLVMLIDAGQTEQARKHLQILESTVQGKSRDFAFSLLLQRVRLDLLDGDVDSALSGLGELPDDFEGFDMDDAMALEWIVDRLLALPRDSSGLIAFRAADALRAAEMLWERDQRDDNMARIEALRGRLAQFVTGAMPAVDPA